MNLSTQLFAVLALAGTSATASEIHRCTSSRGEVTYQQVPCASGTESRAMELVFPEVNREARDRLLQREAALDARLLKRAEIDAAERIAREERLGRERIAQAIVEAERIRAQAEAPVLVVARPLNRRQRYQRMWW